jgi:hypothetical protein
VCVCVCVYVCDAWREMIVVAVGLCIHVPCSVKGLVTAITCFSSVVPVCVVHVKSACVEN